MGQLRVQGIILAGKPERLIEINAHHSLEIELGERIDIVKKEWRDYQIQRLKKAIEASKRKPLLVVVLDDEVADIAWLKDFALERIVSIRSKKAGKQFKEEENSKSPLNLDKEFEEYK